MEIIIALVVIALALALFLNRKRPEDPTSVDAWKPTEKAVEEIKHLAEEAVAVETAVVAKVKKTAAKTTAKKAPAKKRTPNAAFMKPLTPSAALAAVIGSTPSPRTEVVSKLWTYIKKHNLQDKVNKRNINADDKLGKVFGGKKTVSMFEMTKLISGHLK